MSTATTIRPRLGQTVEFVTNHPAARGQTIRGRVSFVGTSMYPGNPVVDTDFGGIELLAKWWGNEVRVVD
jgi:hypothetical protein